MYHQFGISKLESELDLVQGNGERVIKFTKDLVNKWQGEAGGWEITERAVPMFSASIVSRIQVNVSHQSVSEMSSVNS